MVLGRQRKRDKEGDHILSKMKLIEKGRCFLRGEREGGSEKGYSALNVTCSDKHILICIPNRERRDEKWALTSPSPPPPHPNKI